MSEPEDKRDAVAILIGTVRALNSTYNPGHDEAKLDAAEALHANELIVRPGTDADPAACGNDPPCRELSTREKNYTDVVAAVRDVSRRGNAQRTRVRAAALLLKWGES